MPAAASSAPVRGFITVIPAYWPPSEATAARSSAGTIVVLTGCGLARRGGGERAPPGQQRAAEPAHQPALEDALQAVEPDLGAGRIAQRHVVGGQRARDRPHRADDLDRHVVDRGAAVRSLRQDLAVGGQQRRPRRAAGSGACSCSPARRPGNSICGARRTRAEEPLPLSGRLSVSRSVPHSLVVTRMPHGVGVPVATADAHRRRSTSRWPCRRRSASSWANAGSEVCARERASSIEYICATSSCGPGAHVAGDEMVLVAPGLGGEHRSGGERGDRQHHHRRDARQHLSAAPPPPAGWTWTPGHRNCAVYHLDRKR